MSEEGAQSGESSLEVIRAAQCGNRTAIEKLCRRFAPHVRRMAHGRLPRAARRMVDSDDVVQDVLSRTFKNLPRLNLQAGADLIAYLRRAVDNRVIEEKRKLVRQRPDTSLGDSHQDSGPSPIEEAIGTAMAERYETALKRLPRLQQLALVARIEMGLAYRDIGEMFDKSEDATRMMIQRALLALATEVKGE